MIPSPHPEARGGNAWMGFLSSTRTVGFGARRLGTGEGTKAAYNY